MAPRSVVIDDSVEAHLFSTLLPSGVKAQAGLLVGRVTPKRSFVVATIPTPSVGGAAPLTAPAGGAPASAKRPPPKASVDTDLLAEHARQVAALLPGGVAVVGVYAFVGGGLAAAGDGLAAAWAAATTPAPDAPPLSPVGLLLGVCCDSRKLALREVSAGDAKPAEVRFGKVVATLTAVTSTYPLAALAPVPHGDASVLKALRAAVAVEASRAAASVAVVGGAPLAPTAPAAPALAGGAPSPDGGGVAIDLLPPAACDGAWSGGGGGGGGDEASATVRLGGWVRARAVAHDRDSGADVVSSLAADVDSTLTARLTSATRDAEDAGEGVGVLAPPPPAGGGAAAHLLARRVWWTLAPPITVGELAPPGGSVEDDVLAAADAAEQLLGRAGLGGADVVFGEAAARSAPPAAVGRKAEPAAAAPARATTTAPPPTQAIAIIAALLVAAAAVVAALVLRAAGGAGDAATAGLNVVGGE